MTPFDKGRLTAGVATIAVLVCLAASAGAADKTGCANPSWAQGRMPGFEITSCSHRDWARVSVSVRGADEKLLEGEVDRVEFTLVDPSKDPTNAVAWKHFVTEGQKFGATLASEPTGGWSASLTRKTPQGEFWYTYTHSSGNDESTGSFTLTTVRVAPLKQEVVVRATEENVDVPPGGECRNPSWLVKQFPSFKLDACETEDYGSVTIDLDSGPKTIAGRVGHVVFRLTDPMKDPPPYAVWKNYVDALRGIGATLVTRQDDANQALLTRKTAQGEAWYFYQHASGNEESTTEYELTDVRVGAPPPNKCTLEVHGVNFDFDQATLRPDSEPVLNQVLALFQHDPSYAAEVGGHTDNVGDKAHNRTLSSARAAAVKAWLTSHGVAASRLSTAGYGDDKPLAPNTTDANRARNRRVELTRANCKG